MPIGKPNVLAKQAEAKYMLDDNGNKKLVVRK